MGIIKLSEKAERVYYHYAQTHYKLKNYISSSYYLKQFYNTFPNSPLAEEALFLSAESFEKLSPSFRLTQDDTEKAIEGYQLFVNTFPGSQRVSISNDKIDKLRKKLEEKELDNAKGYFRRMDFLAAAHCFKNMLVEFPDSKNAEEIRFMILKSNFFYAKESILTKQAERFKIVKTEFEHNLSQQIYLSNDAWELVKTAKEEIIKTINISSSKVSADAPSNELAMMILNITANLNAKLPTELAINFIKREIAQTF
jgi:outer membrane protein assembly factor BamD